MSSSKKHTLSIDLPTEMVNWLDSSMKSQSLKSVKKAVRCCVNCVATGDVEMSKEINNVTVDQKANHQKLSIELATEQLEWVDSICSSSKGSSRSDVIRSVIEACMKADADVVFGVIRCKSKVTVCKGAQDAVDSLTERYGADGVKIKENIEFK